jgi:hypothetical protein
VLRAAVDDDDAVEDEEAAIDGAAATLWASIILNTSWGEFYLILFFGVKFPRFL